jgi:hypothetical protein
MLYNFINCSNRIILPPKPGALCSISDKSKKYNYSYPSESKILEIMKNPLLSDFSKKSIEFSIAYNFQQELIKLKTFEKEEPNKESPSSRYLLQKQLVFQHIHFAQADISAMESELRCYDDRFSEIIKDLKDKEEELIREFSLYAILASGIGALMDGGSYYYPSINQVAIVLSGILITYYTYLTIDPIVQYEFNPKSTILKDLGTNPEFSNSFSKPIWFLLTNNYSNCENKITQREKLVEGWVKSGYLGNDRKNTDRLTELYFGKGGLSNINETVNRKKMIYETLVLLDLYQQYIRTFQYEILY